MAAAEYEQIANLNLQPIEDYLAEQPDVVVAYLFGSVARQQIMPGSDLDVAVLLDPTVSLVERQLELMLALDEFTALPVQVTLLNQAPPLLAFQVIRDGLLLHRRSKPERIEFEVRVMKIYHDLKPALDFFNAQFLKRIKEVGLGRRDTDPSRTLEAARRLYKRLEAASER